MSDLKDQLRADLVSAIRARDEITTATLRMTLTAITNEEVAGKQARELNNDDVILILAREGKRRREAAEAFAHAGRADLAERERAEEAVLERYLPSQLSDEELAELVRDAISESGVTNPQQMGLVMKSIQPKVVGRAEGKRVADEVRRQLSIS